MHPPTVKSDIIFPTSYCGDYGSCRGGNEETEWGNFGERFWPRRGDDKALRLMWHSNGDHRAPALPGTKATLARQARSQNGDKIAVCKAQKLSNKYRGGVLIPQVLTGAILPDEISDEAKLLLKGEGVTDPLNCAKLI